MRILIVDGHSIIFAWPELRKLHGRRTALARDELVKQLTAYQDASGVRVVAVFDGKGVKSNEATVPGGIQVFYSASGQTADKARAKTPATARRPFPNSASRPL
jgi:predicted RNA-binding protein with PIN domain